jgi:hypothetical protein
MSLLPPKFLKSPAGAACAPPLLGNAVPKAALRDQISWPDLPSTACTPPPSVPTKRRQAPSVGATLIGTTGERLCAGLPSDSGFQPVGHAPPAGPRCIAWTTPALSTV